MSQAKHQPSGGELRGKKEEFKAIIGTYQYTKI
jgi:hypothetical protein